MVVMALHRSRYGEYQWQPGEYKQATCVPFCSVPVSLMICGQAGIASYPGSIIAGEEQYVTYQSFIGCPVL